MKGNPLTPTSIPINPSVPPEMRKRLLWLSDRARSMGIALRAGKGSGKSRLMGRAIAWQDFIRGVPLVVLDPNGPTIDNFLDKVTRLPREYQEKLWRRVLYVDMSGRGSHVVPFPLYYRIGNESLYEIAQRYLEVIRKIDPYLASASVEGWNALWRIGTYIGMILPALNCQISEAERLLTNPEAWFHRFPDAVQQYPEIQPAIEFFTRQYMEWEERERGRRIDSFLNKVSLFRLDPSMKAMFGAQTPGIDWQRVFQKRLAVLLDFRHEYDLERRRFKMLWAFNYFLDFIKHRGAGRHQPASLIIDELTELLNLQTLGVSPLIADLEELINVIARNYGVWLTIAHQELYQLDEHLQKTLMTMGTQIIGTTSDMDAALSLAQQFFPIDPYLVKRQEPVYSNILSTPTIIDYRPVEFTVEEQHYMGAYKIKDQGLFQFLVRPAPGEGDTTGAVYSVTLRNFDRNIWVNEPLVAQARALLSERSGVPIARVLSDIQERLPGGKQSAFQPHAATERGEENDTMISEDAYDISALSRPASDENDDYESLRDQA